MSEVTFVVLASNTKVTKWFASEYQAKEVCKQAQTQQTMQTDLLPTV